MYVGSMHIRFCIEHSVCVRALNSRKKVFGICWPLDAFSNLMSLAACHRHVDARVQDARVQVRLYCSPAFEKSH